MPTPNTLAESVAELNTLATALMSRDHPAEITAAGAIHGLASALQEIANAEAQLHAQQQQAQQQPTMLNPSMPLGGFTKKK